MANDITPTRPQRQAVMAAEPIFDTAAFDHMARIATMIGTSSLLPSHLRVMRDNEGREVPANKHQDVACWLDEKATIANAFLIVSAARNFGGMDPFALAQSSYFVHGRLGYEGKLVQAMIERRVGAMEFAYNGADPASEDYGITVTAWVPNANPERQASVSGTVREWASRKQGALNQQWKGAGGAHRMLHYRGTREWARLYAPALVLGLLDDDDLEHMKEDFRARSARQIAAPTRAFNPLKDEDAAEVEDVRDASGSMKLKEGFVEDVIRERQAEAARAGADQDTGEISSEQPQDGAEAQQGAMVAADAPADAGATQPAAEDPKPATKRLPRGFPQKVDWARLKLSEARDLASLDAAWAEHAKPLVDQIEAEGLPRPSIDRLTEMADQRRVALTPQDTKAADQAPAPADVADWQVRLDHLRDELAAAQTFEDVDDVVDATAWLGDDTPVNVMGLADDMIGERREAIGSLNAQAAEAGDTKPAEPAPTADQLSEMVTKWIGDMRKLKTSAELDQYNLDHITPFMQGPHASLLPTDELDDAKQTFSTRRSLMLKREEDAGK